MRLCKMFRVCTALVVIGLEMKGTLLGLLCRILFGRDLLVEI